MNLKEVNEQKHKVEGRLNTIREQYGKAAYAAACGDESKAEEARNLRAEQAELNIKLDGLKTAEILAVKAEAALARKRQHDAKKAALAKVKAELEKRAKFGVEMMAAIEALGVATSKYLESETAAFAASRPFGIIEELVPSQSDFFSKTGALMAVRNLLPLSLRNQANVELIRAGFDVAAYFKAAHDRLLSKYEAELESQEPKSA